MFLPARRKIQNGLQTLVLSYGSVLKKNESLSVMEKIHQKLFFNIHRICMSIKKHFMEQTSLLAHYLSRTTDDLSDIVKETLRYKLKPCAAFSLAFDEITDISDTALLVIFIRDVEVGLDVVEEFLHMASLSYAATGQDIHEHVIRVVEKFELSPAKLCSLTTYGAPIMTGRTNFSTRK